MKTLEKVKDYIAKFVIITILLIGAVWIIVCFGIVGFMLLNFFKGGWVFITMLVVLCLINLGIGWAVSRTTGTPM